MEVFKITVAVNGRDLEALVKAGVMATIETGSHENKVHTPRNKVNIIVGKTEEPVAWVQISQFDENRVVHVIHEGWVKENCGNLESLSELAPTKASIERVANPPEESNEMPNRSGIWGASLLYVIRQRLLRYLL